MRKLKNEELNRLSVEEFKNKEKAPLIFILENIRSLNNVGSAFRTADSFLIEKIYLCGITGRPPHREINKTALGATESVSWEYVEDSREVMEKYKKQGYKVVAVEQADESTPLSSFHPETDKLVFVFGNEVSGVTEDIVHSADQVIEIPQFGTKHSLNIAVSIGIVTWDILTKLKRINFD